MSRSTAISLVRKYLEKRLEPLRLAFAQRWPNWPFPLRIVDGDGEEAHRILRNELYQDLYNVTADFVVLDTCTGFVGVFKSYGLPKPPTAEPQDGAPADKHIVQAMDDLINDLRQLAYLYECQRYDEENKVRPPSYVLFAVLPEEAKDRLPRKVKTCRAKRTAARSRRPKPTALDREKYRTSPGPMESGNSGGTRS